MPRPTGPERRVPRFPAIVLVAATLAAGCGGSAAARSDARGAGARRGPTTWDRLDAGDVSGAVAGARAALAESPDDPALQEEVRAATRLAAQRHAEAAATAARAGDMATAARELAVAEEYDADAAPVRKVRAVLGAKLAAHRETAASKARARELLRTDPQAAVEVLNEARGKAPYDAELVELVTDATRRAEADRAAERAAEAWDAGLRARAVEHLAAADHLGQPVPRARALLSRMETDLLADAAKTDAATLRAAWRVAVDAKLPPSTVDHLRDRLGEALARAAREHEAAGRIATAGLFQLEAQRIGAAGETGALDRARAARVVVLHVPAFDDATGGSVDGLRLARALRDRVKIDALGGSSALIVTDEPAPRGAAFPRLVVAGEATSARITSGRIARETQTVRYVAGTRDSRNPAAARLDEELGAARKKLADAGEVATSAETRLRELEALPFGKGPGGRVGTEGDVVYQTRLASARAAVSDARRAVQAAQQDEFGVRQRILATPANVAEAVWAEAPLEVTTLSKSAEIVVRLRVLDGDEELLARNVTGAAVHRETVAPALPAAGVAADPDDTPDDATMAARAADRFAEEASGAVRGAAERGARRLLEEARAAERRSEPQAAAEAYAAFLLSTPETATPERADAARALHEILGSPPVVRTGYRADVRR